MSSKEIALEVDGLSKRYLISQQERSRYLGDAIMAKIRRPLAKHPKVEHWALRDISFDVKKGEVLGIIGRNGAGKSTLLKILSQIAEPTDGEVRLYGRVGSLLEVGTGFHPELTGRENIYMNGTILGMRKHEVESQFDAIVDFAEVSKFLDTPVKRYSSGMYVRLAFAVAAHLNPDILILDEVLAVGDARFQAKCLGKMQDVSSQEGRTVLFVSHNMAAVRKLCTRAALLTAGQLEFLGDVDQATSRYAAEHVIEGTIVQSANVVTEGMTIEEISCNGNTQAEVELMETDYTLEFNIRGVAHRALQASVEITISDLTGVALAYFGEGHMLGVSPQIEAGPFDWKVSVDFPGGIHAGTYLVSIDIAHHYSHYWVRFVNAIRLIAEGKPSATGEPIPYSDTKGFLSLNGTVQRSS